jgi:hypothetical protein
MASIARKLCAGEAIDRQFRINEHRCTIWIVEKLSSLDPVNVTFNPRYWQRLGAIDQR